MGFPVPLTIDIDGVRTVVGKAFFDPANGEVHAMVDQSTPQAIKDIIWPTGLNEFSIRPRPVLTQAPTLMTTTTTTTTTEGA